MNVSTCEMQITYKSVQRTHAQQLRHVNTYSFGHIQRKSLSWESRGALRGRCQYNMWGKEMNFPSQAFLEREVGSLMVCETAKDLNRAEVFDNVVRLPAACYGLQVLPYSMTRPALRALRLRVPVLKSSAVWNIIIIGGCATELVPRSSDSARKMTALLLFSALAICRDAFPTFVGAGAPPGLGSLKESRQPAELEDGVDKAITEAALEDVGDWSSVPVEDEFGDIFNGRPTMGNAEQKGIREDIRDDGASPETGLYVPKSATYSNIYEELGGSIPLEGVVPASGERKKGSALEQTKRFATNFLLATPSKKQLVLLGKDILTGKDLEEVEKKKRKRKKRREKLEFERVKRQQRKKYDSTVELVEQTVSRKSPKFKALQKILIYLQKLSEGIG